MSSSSRILQLQKRPENIRNICILAHVDHGKTTLSDFLVSSNGVISSKMAGRLRYLDSRPDEQERCITMKASCISLVHQNRFLINLIDSPGHVDFSSEVASAARLCDGAIVLVDVLEGIRVQTQSVLKQAWVEGVKPFLVINKMDRLISELHLSPMDAYLHIRRLLERINALTSTFLTSESMRDTGASSDDAAFSMDESKQLVFSPELGNVVFASAIDCWGFSILDAAAFYSKALGMKKEGLERVLWGEYYYMPKTKSISQKPKGKVTEPMFVQFVLRNLFRAYECLVSSDRERRDRMVESLGLKVPARELHSKEAKTRVSSVLSRWFPVADAVLGLAVRQLPSPVESALTRFDRIWPTQTSTASSTPSAAASAGVGVPVEISTAVRTCCADENAPLVVFVSKMVAVPSKSLQQGTSVNKFVRQPYVRNKFAKPAPQSGSEETEKALASAISALSVDSASVSSPESDQAAVPTPVLVTEEDVQLAVAAQDTDASVAKPADEPDLQFMAVARVFSGVLTPQSVVHVFLAETSEDVSTTLISCNSVATVENGLRLFSLMGRDVEPVPWASAGQIVGIIGLQDVVLSSATLSSHPGPLLPMRRLTFQSSPIVRVAIRPRRASQLSALASGLRLLALADPNVRVSVESSGEHVLAASGELHLERCLRDLKDRFAPDVPVHVSPPLVNFRETVSCACTPIERVSSSGRCRVRIRAEPLSEHVAELLQNSASEIALVSGRRAGRLREQDWHDHSALLQRWRHHLKEHEVDELQRQCWSFGPRRRGPNVLHVNPELENEVEHACVAGFQMACSSGPLCDEELFGVRICIEEVEASPDAAAAELMLCVKEACRDAVMASSPRLVEGMYALQLQCTTEQLGNLCGVIGRRRGRTTQDDMIGGTDLFDIEAMIPVVESIGLAHELRSKTSGSATPQLVFSHWQIVDVDPFWVPTTEQEMEEFGTEFAQRNLARRLIDSVRRRKGLHVQDKVIEHAEKQRTLKK